jgi:hypothetical protein
MKVAAWQYTLGARVRDAITAYYARYPDAKPGEIEAWLRDRGFDVSLSDVEDYMAALDSRPDWRSAWINRNIHRYADAFDPDQYLAMRSYGEDKEPRVVVEEESADGPEEGEEESEAEETEEGEGEYEDEESEEGEDAQGEEFSVEALAPAVSAPVLGGEDRLPGIALAVVGLAVSAGIIAVVIAVLR